MAVDHGRNPALAGDPHYFWATRAPIDRDFDRAIDLLKAMPEGDRHRATVFMEGLAQMRKEFKSGASDL